MKFTAAEEELILRRSGLGYEGGLVGAGEINRIREMYDAPGRYYHDWGHALSVLSWVNHVFEHVPLGAKSHPAMCLAALFHDIVYVVGASDNESRSVAVFRAFMDQCAAHFPCGLVSQSEVAELIMATVEHGRMEREHVASEAVAHFMDCDLVSLAEPRWEVALQTDQTVRRELESKFSEEKVREGRQKFLGGLLAKRSIFLSRYFQDRFEAQARLNVRRLLDLELSR